MTKEQLDHLRYLAQAAKPCGDSPMDSWKQINLENLFFDFLYEFIGNSIGAERLKNFETYCLKATAEERIDEGLKMAEAIQASDEKTTA
jgi:hypothetical protein